MPICLLVVDDEPDLEVLIRQRFRRQIRDGEMDFSFAGDGIEALEHLGDAEDIDIVLADINMPRMDGLTLLEKLREQDRLLKVVIVSAYGDMSNIRTAMNRGAFDFVTKPIDFEDLEATIRKTYAELNKLKEAEEVQKEFTALQRELEIASEIQFSSLPPTAPTSIERDEVDLHATIIPAKEVGGDFYDYFLVGDDRLGFALGDVSGKGVGAALFMAVTRTLLRATALRGLAPAECLCRVNRALYPESMANMFVTLVYGVLDLTTGEVTYCNAGHHTPYVLGREAGPEASERADGLGLCLTGDFSYQAQSATLRPGEGLLLYSDGVPEAADAERALFGDERLHASLGSANGSAPAEVIRSVLRALESFTDGAPPADDITMLAFQYQG